MLAIEYRSRSNKWFPVVATTAGIRAALDSAAACRYARDHGPHNVRVRPIPVADIKATIAAAERNYNYLAKQGILF